MASWPSVAYTTPSLRPIFASRKSFNFSHGATSGFRTSGRWAFSATASWLEMLSGLPATGLTVPVGTGDGVGSGAGDASGAAVGTADGVWPDEMPEPSASRAAANPARRALAPHYL